MTYSDCDDRVCPELKLRIEDENGDYVKLGEEDGCEQEGGLEPSSPTQGRSLWWWMKVVLLFIFLGALAVVFLKWVGPFLIEKEVIPIISWETATFSTPELAFVIVATVALFPSLLLPSTPSMWVAGMTFGYGFGFLLIIAGVTIGVSLPYFIGSLFYHKIQEWFEKYPSKASVIRLAGEGNWFQQFQTVTLIRISPFPYVVFNYCAVATDVKYVPYLLGSLVGMVPEIFVAIYTGILIRALADASHDRHILSTTQILLNVAGFCATVASAVIFTVYAKARLRELKKEEEPLLQ